MHRSSMAFAIGAVLLGTVSLSADEQSVTGGSRNENRVAQFGPPFGFPSWDSRGGSYDRGRRVEDSRDRQPEPPRDSRSTRPFDDRPAAPPPFLPPWMRAPAASEPSRRPAAAPQQSTRPFAAPAGGRDMMRAWMDRWRTDSSSSRSPAPFASRFGAASRAPERAFAGRTSSRGRPAAFARSSRCGGGRGFVAHRFGRGPMQSRGFSGRASFGAFRPWSRGFGFGGRGPAFGFGDRGDWRTRMGPPSRTPAPRGPAAAPRAPEPPRRPTESARPGDLERRLDRVLQEIEDMRRELRRR